MLEVRWQRHRLPRRWQRHTEVCADRLGQKRVRHAGEHASAVARGGLAAAAAAMVASLLLARIWLSRS